MDSVLASSAAVAAVHPNLLKLSNSAQDLLEACPRLFELDRLSPRLELDEKDVHLDFGKLVGSAVQDFLVTGSLEEATWRAFLSYPRDIIIDDLDDKEAANRHKKDFWFALIALEKFTAFAMEELSDYKLIYIDNKPATELGFIIDCDGGFQYRGKLDAGLINKKDKLACLELKTTGNRNIHPAMFQNSGQGIGYSAIVDAIASKLGLQQAKSFPIIYPVYQTHAREWHSFRFVKSRTAHANWLRHLLRSIQHISEYAQDDFFPMYGQSCYRFGRACKFFDVCEMQNKYVVGTHPEIKVDKEEDYQFRFSLDELIEAQLSKVLG